MLRNHNNMAAITGEVDQYGFERPTDFDYDSYESFMSEYLRVLARRAAKWQKLLGDNNANLHHSSKVKRYVRKGIPSESRGDARNFGGMKYFCALLVTMLNHAYRLSSDWQAFNVEVWLTISKARRKLAANPEKYKEIVQGEKDIKIVEMIERDIKRTYPENIYFREVQNSQLDAMRNVLVALSHHNVDVGYCQGFNYVAGMLLLVTKDECHSFWLFVDILERLVPDFYSSRLIGVRVECAVLMDLIHQRHPDLHMHFKENNVDLELACSKWFICLFMDVLPVETVLRIWDSLFYEGSKILLRVALTLIILNKEKFLESRGFDGICKTFKEITKNVTALNCHAFMQACFKIPGSLSMAKIKAMRAQHEVEILKEEEEMEERRKKQ